MLYTKLYISPRTLNFRHVINFRRLCSTTPPLPPANYDATKYRNWIQLNTHDDPDSKITIMTYNLLSRHYMWHQVFGYLDQNYLSWTDYRFPLINKTIKQFESDIMCFQEMEHFIYESFWSDNFPNSKYKSFYIRKPNPGYWGNQPSEFMDGVGIFINTDKFDVLDHLEINFGDYILKNKHEFEPTHDFINRVAPRNTVALILKVLDRRNNKILYITNTHLYWSPKFNDVKIIQTKILLNILKKFITTQDPYIIMFGDLNSTPDSKVYQLLENQQINAHDCVEFINFNYGEDNQIFSKGGIIKNPFELECVYETLIKNKNLNFTSFTRSLTAVLDHIWINKNHFKVLKVLSEVDRDYCSYDQTIGFPNSHFPSDHIPLVAELSYL